MNHQPTIPDPEKVKQTLANARHSCHQMELAGLQLEEVIVKLEQENRQRRIKQLKNILKEQL